MKTERMHELKEELKTVRIDIDKAFDELDQEKIYQLFKKDDDIFNKILRLQHEN